MASDRSPRVFRSATARRRFLVHAIVGAIAFILAVAVFLERFEFLLDPIEARAFVSDFGVFAPAALVILQALQVVLAPIPGQVLAVVAGYLFGPWWGTLYNMIGIAIGSTAAFWLSRRYGRRYVESIVHDELLDAFDGIADDHALASLFVLFLVPGMPDDVLCFVGGVTNVRLWKLVVVAIVGRTPAFFLVNVFGARLGAGDLNGAVVLAIVLVVMTGLGYLYRDRLLAALERGDRLP